MIVRDGSRALRRSVRPVVWLVLEELALNAVTVDGIVTASTSARAIAAELGLDPATTASALRVLRDRGLVELTRETGAAGRFGLSVYRLGPIPGVEVLAPCPKPPQVDGPHMVTSDMRRWRGAGPANATVTAIVAVEGSRAGRAGLGVGQPMRGARFACPEGWQVSVALFALRLGVGRVDGDGVDRRRVPVVVGGVGDRRVLRRRRGGAGCVVGRMVARTRCRAAWSKPTQLRALIDGNHPVSGAPLLAGLRERSVKAFDLTFSAPKSVSLLWALGSEPVADTVMTAHRDAVAAALGFLEEHAATARMQIDGVRRHVATHGWVVAGFVHRTSREGDPQLHTHCLVPNVVRREAGRAVCGVGGPSVVRVGPGGRVDLSGRAATGAVAAARCRVGAGPVQHPRSGRVHDGPAAGVLETHR